MGTETSSALLEAEPSKPGLVFDADTITLSGKFTDELSAYRARKKWKEVFGTYFLLEDDRDFEMCVKPSQAGSNFVLHCIFCSACGRYAFWRMINRQAPDAESKLYTPNIINEKSARLLLGSIWSAANTGPWIYSGDGKRAPRRRKSTILESVFGRIQKAFS